MSRYIDVEKPIVRLKKDPLYPFVERYRMIRVLEAEPTADVVEVVRCRDCRFSKDTGDYQDSYYCNHPTHNQEHLVHSRDYCSCGAKMDVDFEEPEIFKGNDFF